jgi:hypothetical protein
VKRIACVKMSRIITNTYWLFLYAGFRLVNDSRFYLKYFGYGTLTATPEDSFLHKYSIAKENE